MEKVKSIKKINVSATIKSMPLGSELELSSTDADIQSVRVIASRLKSFGTFSVKKAGAKISVNRLS